MDNSRIYTVPATELMSPFRFDLMAKYTYVECREKNYDTDFARELYLRHIEAFSGGTFKEPGSETKHSAEAYLSEFDELIDSIKRNGYDSGSAPVPVNKNRVIGDGAHRVAICAYFGLDVPVEEEDFDVCYDYSFFREMYLSESDSDYIATRYAESSGRDTHVFCVWPAAFKYPEKLDEARKLIPQDKIVYKKNIFLTYNGLKDFMIQIYADFDWAGTPVNQFKGIYGKLDPCFEKNCPVEVYLLQCSNEEIIELKSEFRDIVGIQNHSCHSSDNRKDALLMTHLLFNENSVQLLNGMDIEKCDELLEIMLQFRDTLYKKKIDPYSVIIDSSSIMGILGIRKTRDLDYISLDNVNLEQFDNHEEYLVYYGLTKTDLLFNPCNYAFIFDVKIITLSVLRKMKETRSEKKDREDVLLIADYMNKNHDFKTAIKSLSVKVKRGLRNRKTAIRDFLEGHNIKIFTKIWHFMKGKGFKA